MILERAAGALRREWLARALAPLSWAYGAAALARRAWLSRRARRLERPVISVGNISCGGTGKTPAVEMIARDLLRMGLRPAILSRGYGAPRGSGTARSPASNDELLVLRANLPEVPHLQGKDRYRRGLEAVRAGAQILVLDDGFQHVRLHRDLDLVTIDAIVPFGLGRVLPAGLLREPLAVLETASLLAITRSDQVEPRTLSTLSSYLRARFPGIPQVRMVTRPIEWRRLDGAVHPPQELRGSRVLAFCGIGNPEGFRRQLAALGVDLRAFVPFGDHHLYTEADLERLAERAAATGAREVVMTQKDAVKVEGADRAAGWRYLRIESRIVAGEADYRAALERVAAAARRAGEGAHAR